MCPLVEGKRGSAVYFQGKVEVTHAGDFQVDIPTNRAQQTTVRMVIENEGVLRVSALPGDRKGDVKYKGKNANDIVFE